MCATIDLIKNMMTENNIQKGVLLVNMGGPLNEKDMKTFLVRMFNDPHIMPLNILGRKALAFLISNSRYKKSWAKYELIGGTPIVETTNKMTQSLADILPEHHVKMAFSYSPPFIGDVLKTFSDEDIKHIHVIPQYPHYSFTTYQSVLDECARFFKMDPSVHITYAPPYFGHPLYISFWAELVKKHCEKENLKSPMLLFSAHSIPMTFVEKGDTYPQEIAESAKLIAESVNMKFEVSYQSQIKGSAWVGPPTPEVMKRLKSEGVEELVIIPISFVTENLETMYDLDHDLVPFGKNTIGIKHVSRVRIDFETNTYLELLRDLAEKKK